MCQLASKISYPKSSPSSQRANQKACPNGFHLLLLGVSLGLCFSFLSHRRNEQCTSIIQNYFYRHQSNQRLDARVNFLVDDTVTSAKPQAFEKKLKRLVLIGVMTAKKYIGTRAVAVYNTWGQSLDGKVVFFTGENTTEEDLNGSEIPFVRLPGVDDSYPPQKKSFMMLKYMFENYGNDYEWFMRADDDVYTQTEKLEDFLRSIDSNRLFFIGQTGRGNEGEFGKLHLAYNENFCMGGPGNIFSHATFHRIGPHLEQCLAEMLTTHEDVEVGRCVHRFAGISCTWAYDMQSIFYHNSSGNDAFTGSLKHGIVHRAATLHPIKDHNQLYRLHSYFQERKVEQRVYEAIQLQRDLLFVEKELVGEGHSEITAGDGDYITAFDSYNVTGLPPSLQKFVPSNTSELLQWTFIGRNGLSDPNALNPRQKPAAASKEALQDVIRELMEVINGLSKVRGRVIQFQEVLYGYHRVDPLHGEDFVLDLQMTYKKYRGKKMTLPVRRHAYIQRPFAPLQFQIIQDSVSSIQKNFVPKPTSLVFILTLSGRLDTFERFLENYAFNCQTISDDSSFTESLNVSLVVVLFGSGPDAAQMLELIDAFKKRIQETTTWKDFCKIKVIQLQGDFSRGVGLQTGINACQDDDLLFLIDVDIVVSPVAIRRILANTIQHAQVYFPIVFSEYSTQFLPEEVKSASSFQISEDTGYWREFGFGIAAFYKSDFNKVGGFDLGIRGWGKEDVLVYDKFLHTNLTIFRAPDPELLHLYHRSECDPALAQAQLNMCIGSQTKSLGSWQNLLKFILRNRQKSQHFQKLADLVF